jgi:mono/diheme cytochrome c family protein
LAFGVGQVDLAGQDHPGQVPYDKVCRACHGPRGAGDQAPRLVPIEREIDEVLAIVREGLGQMPQISRREVSDDEVRLIVKYLKSLSPATLP